MPKNLKLGTNVVIHENVSFGENVTVSDFCVIHPNVVIGDNVFIGSFSIIGEPTAEYYHKPDYKNPQTQIGSHSIIRSHSVIYADVQIGNYFESGHRITIRTKTSIGEHSKIGTLCDLQGESQIGHYVRLHGHVEVGEKSNIKDFVWIFSSVVLTNDPTPPSNIIQGVTVNKFAVIACGSIIMPRVTIGEDALVGALSLVRNDVPKEMVVAGNPAKEICSVRDIKNKFTGEQVYPWRYTFRRGMPWEADGYENWEKSLKSGG